MKKIILIYIVFTYQIQAQVAVDKTTVDGGSILDFPNPTNKGLVLPIVETLPTSPVNGTILMDKTDAKIKLFENNNWVSVTKSGSTANVLFNASPETNSSVVIGADSSTANGVLVLESSTKALILPRVINPETTIINPSAGTIVYDLNSKSVAFFNGLEWNYYN